MGYAGAMEKDMEMSLENMMKKAKKSKDFFRMIDGMLLESEMIKICAKEPVIFGRTVY